MLNIKYLEPKSVGEACSLLSTYGEEAKIIAGGTAVVILIKERLIKPRFLIDLSRITFLDHLNYAEKEGLGIGALATHRSLETAPLIQEKFGVLREMARQLGTVQIRNVGTLGGSLCHAEPAADPAPVLLTLGAKVKLASQKGERVIPLEEFFIDFYETSLGPEEILTEILVPNLPPRTGSVYTKYTLTAGDRAIVGVAVSISLGVENNFCQDIRIGLGAVANTPMRAKKTEAILRGQKISADKIEETAFSVSQEASPIDDINGSASYKRELIGVLTRRTINQALKNAQTT